MNSNYWETHIKPYIKEIEEWAKRGITAKDIADKLSVGYSTFRKYAREKNELEEALRNGQNYVKRVVDKALQENKQMQSKKINKAPPLTTYTSNKNSRPDQNGTHRKAFERNKKKIYTTQSECGICGRPVDFKVKYPNPLSPCIDHIIPVSKGGHPSDISNLQLAHWTCNRQKADKLTVGIAQGNTETIISNRILPQTIDWKTYRSIP